MQHTRRRRSHGDLGRARIRPCRRPKLDGERIGERRTGKATLGQRPPSAECQQTAATNADPGIDWESERFPTHCVFEVEVELPERPRYRLVLPDVLPVEFERSLLDRDEPLRLVLSG